jgi:hypothetical protein
MLELCGIPGLIPGLKVVASEVLTHCVWIPSSVCVYQKYVENAVWQDLDHDITVDVAGLW